MPQLPASAGARAALGAVAVLALVAGAAWWAAGPAAAPEGAAGGPRDLARGEALYAVHCASCHGAELEGAPDWRTPLANGRLPAPPHDASGHTWHHPDHVLFAITKLGSAAVVGGGYQSDMPGFAEVMSDAEIRDVLAWIKSSWPERERRHQAELTRRAGAAP